MAGFVKLQSSILQSTVWREPNHIRILWITMLAMKGHDGVVEASVPGLADAARITLDECEEGLERLLAPDKYSRTKEHDGRRIEEIDGGWLVLNHEKYRGDTSTERVRKHREKKQRETLRNVTQRSETQETRETASDQIRSDQINLLPETKAPPPKEKKKRASKLPEDWTPNDSHGKLAWELGLNTSFEAGKFRDHAEANDRKQKDWNAAFRMWLKNAYGFMSGRGTVPNPVIDPKHRKVRVDGIGPGFPYYNLVDENGNVVKERV